MAIGSIPSKKLYVDEGIIDDDFGDNVITRRTNAYLLISGGDLYPSRPSWSISAGTGVTASGGKMIMEAETEVTITGNLEVGEWTFWFSYAGSTSTNFSYFYFNYSDSNHHGEIKNDADGNVTVFLKTGNGTGRDIITATGDGHNGTTEGIFRLTRDASGNYELFIDETSEGTATDSSITATSSYKISNPIASTDDLKVHRVRIRV